MDPEHVKKAGQFKKLGDDVATKYQEWHKAVFQDQDQFDKKTLELMALSASAAIRCSYCVDSHSQKAKAAGATQEEIAKVIEVAAIVGAGSTISYGLEALDSA